MRKATDGLKNVNNLLMSLLGTPRGSLVVKSKNITEDYKISSNVLGLGINGKVVECFDQVTDIQWVPVNTFRKIQFQAGEKCALKVLKDNVKSRSENIDEDWITGNLLLIISGEK